MKKIPILIAIVLLAGCSGMRGDSYGGSYGSGSYGAGSGSNYGPNYRGSGAAVPNQVDPATGILVPLG